MFVTFETTKRKAVALGASRLQTEGENAHGRIDSPSILCYN